MGSGLQVAGITAVKIIHPREHRAHRENFLKINTQRDLISVLSVFSGVKLHALI
jgi:hypothetical protein